MPFKTRTSVIFTCRQCGTESDVGTSPDYASIAKCSNPQCNEQEAFTGFPQILTLPQQPESNQSAFSRFLARITASYINLLVAILVNLIVLAMMTLVTYYVVRSAVEKQVPSIVQQEMWNSPTPQR